MKYTNKQNLPAPLVKAIIDDDYDRGEDADYTITELIDPPRKRFLQKKYDAEIVVDVSDEIFRLLGKAVHNILERGGVPERRFAMTILGKTITGKPDRLTKEGLIQDWKVTTVYKFKDGEIPFELEAQLNGYAELMRQNGKKITAVEGVPIFRDWSKRKAQRERDAGYPQSQCLMARAPVWDPKDAIAFLEERVRLHEAAKIKLPDCTSEERWARPDIFAVMKKGRKSSLKNFENREAAEEFIKVKAIPLSIEHRPGESIRCQDYCSAAAFCEQWKKIQKVEEERCNECQELKIVGRFGLYCRTCWRKAKS